MLNTRSSSPLVGYELLGLQKFPSSWSMVISNVNMNRERTHDDVEDREFAMELGESLGRDQPDFTRSRAPMV